MANAGLFKALGAGISGTARAAIDLKELERRAEADAARLKLSMETLELNKKRLTLQQEQQERSRMMEALDIQNDAVTRQRDMEDEKEMLRFRNALEKELIKQRAATPARSTKTIDPSILLSREQAQKDEATQQLQRVMDTQRGNAFSGFMEAGGVADSIYVPQPKYIEEGGWGNKKKVLNPARIKQDEWKWWKRGMASPEVRDSSNVLLGGKRLPGGEWKGGIPGYGKYFGGSKVKKKTTVGPVAPKGFDATKLSDFELQKIINE